MRSVEPVDFWFTMGSNLHVLVRCGSRTLPVMPIRAWEPSLTVDNRPTLTVGDFGTSSPIQRSNRR